METYKKLVVTDKAATLNLGNIYLQFCTSELQSVEVKGRTVKSYKSDYSFLGTKTQTSIIDITQSISSIIKEIIKDSGYLNYITQQNVAEHGVHSYISFSSVNLYFSRLRYLPSPIHSPIMLRFISTHL